MSDQPFGLSADPFALPATLTAEQTARLIENRITACGGDAAVIFPPDTCAEIHRHTHGVTGAVCDLAGRAMRLAATVGAASVSPEHVRAAAYPPANVDAMAAVAEVTAPHAEPAAEVANAEPTTAPATAVNEESAPAPEPPAPERRLVASEQPDDVPDLPEMPQGAFELPSAPSKDLAPAAQAWVSRFLGADPAPIVPKAPVAPKATTREAPKPAAQAPAPATAAARPAPAQTPAQVAPTPAAARPAPAPAAARPAPAPAVAPSPAPGPAPVAARPAPAPQPVAAARATASSSKAPRVERRRSPESPPPPGKPDRRVTRNVPRARERRRSSHAVSWAVASASVLCVVAILAHRLSLDIAAPPRVEDTHVAAARTSPAPLITVTADSTHVAGHVLHPGPGVTTTPVTAPTGDPTATATPATPRGRRLGIEVAAFIFPDRAETERQRLVDAGYPAQVVTEWENGAPSYRVVLGPYRRAAAEGAASALLNSGLVQQARVVAMPTSD